MSQKNHNIFKRGFFASFGQSSRKNVTPRPATNRQPEVPQQAACCCQQDAPSSALQVAAPPVQKAAASLPSLLLSVLVAFFPKCPLCWAAYMSMFGSVGLAQLPYQGWMFPVLLAFLGLHLWFIYRKIPKKGYGPFALSLCGAAILLLGRKFMPGENLPMYMGILCIVAGSFWNSFSWQNASPFPAKLRLGNLTGIDSEF